MGTNSKWMPPIASLEEIDVENVRVFLRVDFNVPLHEDGSIRDDTRIRACLPTIQALRKRNARLVIASHLGRPEGKPDPQWSLETVGHHLAELLQTEIRLPDEVIGDSVRKLVLDTRAGQMVLLENLRFHPGEVANNEQFSQELASLADVYVNDAFAVSHRAHASVVGVPNLIHTRAAGYLMMEELSVLNRLVHEPEHPFVAVIGGAKVSDKLPLLLALVNRLRANDQILIGGAMANTFLASKGINLGKSRHEPEQFRNCQSVLDKAKAREITILLPKDVRIANDLQAKEATIHSAAKDLPANSLALDIGPATEAAFAQAIHQARMLFWNGPMGLFENSAFAQGSMAVAKAVAECPGYTVVGGGDSIAAVEQSGYSEQIDHLSTGGGASLEMLEGRTLPGVEALFLTS